jgi:hypothetical protein
MKQPSAKDRVAIVTAIKTPLAFLVLGVLIVEGTLGTLAYALSEFRGILVWAIVISIPAFVLIVVALAVWQPEALKGDRPLHGSHANQFASDLFLVLDGYLSNLSSQERGEAWVTVADVLTGEEKADDSYSRFCLAVAVRLRRLAKVTNRSLSAPGPIEPKSG